MALRFWYRDPDGTVTEIVGRIESLTNGNGIDLTEKAEEGSVAMSTVVIRDPDMDFTIGGHRIFGVQCTDIADADNDFIYVGYTADRKVVRDEAGTGRNIEVTLADINSILGRRLMTSATWDRSSETDVARVTAVEASDEGELIDDDRYILAAGAETMDAADYRGQYLLDVIRDAAEHTGKNYYVTYFGDNGSTYWGAFSLWYGDPGEADYASTISLTNVAADVDSTHYMVVSAEGNLDPSRVYSGVYLPYRDSFVYVERDETATDFALGGRDAVMPAVNVSTKTKALARANRYLNDAATEDERITVVYRVARADVNLIRPGMRVPSKFLHIDSLAADYTYCRVLSRRITEPNLRQFEVTLELSVPVAEVAAAAVQGTLYLSAGPYDNIVYFSSTGDSPPAGWMPYSTEGLISELTDGSPPNAGWPLYGWQMNGTGTVDVDIYISTAGVMGAGSITLTLLLNDVGIASATQTETGGLHFVRANLSIVETGIAVATNDELTLRLTNTGTLFQRTPAGTGVNTRFKITGGSLA